MTHPLNDHPSESRRRHPLQEPDPRDQEAAALREAHAQGRLIPAEFVDAPQRPYATYVLLFINVVIFGLRFVLPDAEIQVRLAGWLYPYGVVEQGEWWRLITLMFLHANVAHIFMNGYALYVIGSEMEVTFGRWRFLLIYFLGGLLGSILQLLLGGDRPALGASGAVFALFGAEVVYWQLHRNLFLFGQRRLQNLLVVAGLNLVVGFAASDLIANWAHIGGFVGGVLLAWRIGPRYIIRTNRDTSAPPPKTLPIIDSNPLLRRGWLETGVYTFGLVLLCVAAALLLHPQAFHFVTE